MYPIPVPCSVKRCLGSLLSLLALAFLAGCGEGQKRQEPRTPEEMYVRVQELLKPNVEGEASDFSGAMHWLRRAAEGGLLQAQTDLAGIYLEGGRGVKRDGQAAYAWFSRAAAQGCPEAEFYMGHILYAGIDQERQEAAAIGHWRKAAQAGVAEAAYRLGIVLTGNPGTSEEGVSWLQQAAECSVPKLAAQAACALGNLYAKGGDGIAADGAAAAQWYERAALGGDARAQLVYALMLLTGEHVGKDTERGMAMLRMSAGQDYPQAIALLVNQLRNAEDASRYEEEAQAWAVRLEQLREGGQKSADGKPQNREGKRVE